MMKLFDQPENTWELIANGLPWTLTLAGSSLAIGFFLAVGLALVRLSPYRPLQAIAYAYVYLFRSTPLLVQIFLIYYGVGQFEAVRESVAWPVLRVTAPTPTAPARLLAVSFRHRRELQP